MKDGKTQSQINVGWCGDIKMAELATAVAKTVEYDSNIFFDPSKPDGAQRKWIDSSGIN